MEERPTGAAHATDAELVRDARQGDTAAFEALMARHFPMVYALAYARLGAREAAEDLAQEVFPEIGDRLFLAGVSVTVIAGANAPYISGTGYFSNGGA